MRAILISLFFVFQVNAGEIHKQMVKSAIVLNVYTKVDNALIKSGVASAISIGGNKFITCHHNVKDKDAIVLVSGEQDHVAIIVGSTPKDDIAILLCVTLQVPSVEWAKQSPQLGDTVYTVGNPFGEGLHISKGIVSALHKRTFNVDSAINPGNSGCPVYNDKGQLIGMAKSITSIVPQFAGIGTVIPHTRLKQAAGFSPTP